MNMYVQKICDIMCVILVEEGLCHHLYDGQKMYPHIYSESYMVMCDLIDNMLYGQ